MLCYHTPRWAFELAFTAMLLLSFISCETDPELPLPSLEPYTSFGAPEAIQIEGYDGDCMEPFISRDGAYMFFNDDITEDREKNIHYARISAGAIQYGDELTSCNSEAVDGAPCVDGNNGFYYISLADYDGTSNLNTVYSGKWNTTTCNVESITPVSGLSINEFLKIVYDIEVSKDGSIALASIGQFLVGKSIPDSSDIQYALAADTGFMVSADSARIMAEVNTAALEYAACLSADTLELFFNRASADFSTSYICRATRSGINEAFGNVQYVSSIDGFAEGACLSPDEKTLYYHWHNPSSGKFELQMIHRD